jgi:DNA-binding LacI/PurR family transcriptional regulator
MAPMRITIKDIAERAGVSKTTVSFAFNDPRKISKATCERVMAIADDLGYVPDPVARTLTTKRIGAIGLLLPQPMHEALKNPYLTELLQGIGAACLEHETSLLIVPPIKGRLLEAASRAAVDALMAIGVGPDHSIVDLIRKRHIPLITIDGKPSAGMANVGIDDEAAAYALMRYVTGLGHRDIAIVELETESYNEPAERSSLVRDRRRAGFDRALTEAGIRPGLSSPRVYSAVCSIEGGRNAAAHILADGRASAIVAMADIVALGIMEQCAARGLSIPGDISIVAFDDIEMAALMPPGLTTVRQPGFKKGYEAGRVLLGMLNGAEPEQISMEAELVVRGSAAALKAEAPDYAARLAQPMAAQAGTRA